MAEVQIAIGDGGGGRIWNRILASSVVIVIIEEIRPNYPPVYADRWPLRRIRTGRVIVSRALNVDLHTA